MSLDNPVAGTEGKTKVMKIKQEPDDWQPTQREKDTVKVGGVSLPFVKQFLYLGSIRSMGRDLGVSADINRRLAKGTAVMATLEGLWRGKYLARAVKGKLMTTFAIPTALYGCTNWAITSANVRRLRHWWFKMLKWGFGIHKYRFQETGETRESMLRALQVQPIMVYLRRAVVQQIGHIARKPIENPSKQLLFGWVADRVPWRRGARGRRKAPPRTLKEYYKTTLKEIPHPDFDYRIWSLQAQDRSLWRRFAHSVHGNTHYGGGKLGQQSMSTRTQALRTWRHKVRGEVTTTDDPTELQPNRKKHWTKRPLRCGWEGESIGRHIATKHPLHPVDYVCVECKHKTDSKRKMSAHVKMHGDAEIKVVVRKDADDYRWDYRSKFLRIIPKGQKKPRPVGWMIDSIESQKNKSQKNKKPERIRGIFKYKGVDVTEKQRRSDRRLQLLEAEGVNHWRELSAPMKRQWLQTMAHSVGWGKMEKFRARRQPHAAVRRRRGCGRGCGWGDHLRSTPQNCPLHPRYVGHLKPGDKPIGVRGNSDEAQEWRRKQTQNAQRRRDAAHTANTMGIYQCRNQCGASFTTKSQRSAHERSSCTQNAEGAARPLHHCTVPGCDAMYVNQAQMREHEQKCRRKFEYESPTCPACGYQVNDKEERDGRMVVKGRDTIAPSLWASHVQKYKRTKLVTCA